MRHERPQRLTATAPPGALLKRLDGLHTRMRLKEAGERDPVYLAMIRQLPCLHCGVEPCGEAAHVRFSSGAHHKASAIGKRPADRWAAPLCAEHHRLARDAQHNRSEREFWDSLGIPILLACKRLYAVRGDVVAMRAVALSVIGERGTIKAVQSRGQ